MFFSTNIIDVSLNGNKNVKKNNSNNNITFNNGGEQRPQGLIT